MVLINSISIFKAAIRNSGFFFGLLFCLATSTLAASNPDYFLIQLGEYPVSVIEINKSLQNLLPLQVYVESKDNGISWQLNLGFFASEAEAKKIAQSLQDNYPQLLIRNIDETQFKSIQSNRKPPWEIPAVNKNLVVHVDSRPIINSQLERAAELYSKGDYSNAAILYQLLSHVPNDEQAAWALELYGVCLEKQRNYDAAIASYGVWLEKYPANASQPRVQQRLLALNTAIAEPVATRKKAIKKNNDAIIYGSASMSYQGMRREVDGQDPETIINSVATNLDLNMRARTGNILLKSRITGGYLGDYSDREDSDGRVSNLNVTLLHEPSGAELTVGRLRSNDNGIFGYLDGAVFSYPVTENIAVNLAGGTVTSSTSESPDTDRLVYALGTDIQFDNPGWQVHLYAVEQTYEDITERRAVGTEISYFNDYSHYLFIADYDIKFSEANNLLFNGSWDVTTTTNLALSLGYQRSPFLTASNALIGEYNVDLNELVDGLVQGTDIYDAALDKTALSQYASIVVNQQLSERLRFIAEVYHYDLSDLPVYDPNFDSPDSDASTTYGLQFLLAEALFNNDYLSTGIRYTDGDTSSSTSLFIDEKLKINADINMTLRLLATQRSINGLDQDAYTLRPAVRVDWYFTPTLLLDTELGYEWLMQDFEAGDYKVQQGFIVIGLHKRF